MQFFAEKNKKGQVFFTLKNLLEKPANAPDCVNEKHDCACSPLSSQIREKASIFSL